MQNESARAGALAGKHLSATEALAGFREEMLFPKPTSAPNINLVLIPVTVTDPLNRFVTGLEKEYFKKFTRTKTATNYYVFKR